MPDRLRIERKSRVTVYRIPDRPPPPPPPSTPSSTGGEENPDLETVFAVIGAVMVVGLGIVIYCFPKECAGVAFVAFLGWVFLSGR